MKISKLARSLSGDGGSKPRPFRWTLTVCVTIFVIATVAGLVVLWPAHQSRRLNGSAGTQVKLTDAIVEHVTNQSCSANAENSRYACQTVRLRITKGIANGDVATMQIAGGPDQPLLHRGDRIVVGSSLDLSGTVTYYFADFQRRVPLAILGGLFAVVVVVFGRWRGFGACLGLVVSFLVVVKFMLPAILAGESPVAVAIVGSAIIMFFVVYVAHGVNVKTTTALLGTLLSLLVTGLLAFVFTKATRMTGLSSEEGSYIQSIFGSEISLQGLVLAGIILGSLGVLNDVTVTQASAVWEIHMANPAVHFRELYASAIRIGRDHIASTVYTLVLAYAGASLPLFLLLTFADRRLIDVLTGEVVAQEIVRSLVGSIGLVVSVPITTALACFLVIRISRPLGMKPDAQEV